MFYSQKSVSPKGSWLNNVDSPIPSEFGFPQAAALPLPRGHSRHSQVAPLSSAPGTPLKGRNMHLSNVLHPGCSVLVNGQI